MADSTSGLSRREREILQAEGDTPVGQDGQNWAKYRCKIKVKIQPTLTDAILILKHSSGAIDLDDYLVLHCLDDIAELNNLTGAILQRANSRNR